jgi:hypothetical protein
MTPDIAFDRRILRQGSSPSEHGSRAELCFRAGVVLNGDLPRAAQGDLECPAHRCHPQGRAPARRYSGYDAEKRLRRLFDEYTGFPGAGAGKIELGNFALPRGDMKSILLSEEELNQKLLELQRPH